MSQEPSADTAPSDTALQRYFQTAQFDLSAQTLAQCPADNGREIAFAGRSNAGKSSAINCLTSQKKLARTSKTPGRTQLINFFSLNDNCRLVDLPGYGYAKVALKKKLQWQQQMENYLSQRQTLSGLVLLMDCRHPLQPVDRIMLDWTAQYEMRCHILLTKVDKLKRGAAKQALLQVTSATEAQAHTSVQLFSAHDGSGLDQARQQLYQWLHGPPGPKTSRR